MVATALNLAGGLLAAAEGEPSKTAFYIAGSVLAVWAVVLSWIGLRRADFPETPSLARGVMALSAILVVATMATAIITGGKPHKEEEAEAAGGEAGGALVLAAEPGGRLEFDKTTLTAKAGRIVIELENTSFVPHNVTLERDGKKVAASKTITKANAELAAEVTPGSYTYYCSVAGHRAGGMVGKLNVE